MAQRAQAPRMSEAAYLAWEEAQHGRHEYVEGRVYAVRDPDDVDVTEAGDPQAQAVGALGRALRARLHGTRFTVHEGNRRIHLASTAAYFYPELVVDGPGPAPSYPLRPVDPLPVVVVDAPSPSAGSPYPGVRFAHYRTLASLHDYVLLDAHSRRADVCRRQEGGSWTVQRLQERDLLELPILGLKLPLSVVFAGVE